LRRQIAEELQLSAEEVTVAIQSIDAHRAEVEASFDSILRCRDQQRAQIAPTPPTPEELKQRIAHRVKESTHAGPSR
jgi:hypothetical protein